MPAVIPCGTCDACKRFTMDKVELRLSNLMAFHARALDNWGCRPELYPAAFDLVLQGRVKVGPFVEQHPLTDINKVLTGREADFVTGARSPQTRRGPTT